MTKSTFALSPSRKRTYWSMDRLNWTWGYDIFCRKPSKSIWSVHFIALYIMCLHTIMCKECFAHFCVHTLALKQYLCAIVHIFVPTYLKALRICVLLWEPTSPVHMPIVVKLSIEPQSRQIHSVVSCISLCLFRGGPSNLVQSHVDKKKVC